VVALLAGLGLAAGLSVACAQETQQAPPPRKHLPEKHVLEKHVPEKHLKHGPVKHVPVVAPRHAGPPRRLMRGKVAPKIVQPVPEPPKPIVAKAPAAPKKPPVPADVGTNTGLKLPRYAALKTDDANMRSGPGERYPVIWQYHRHDLPVRIEREFDVWRLVEDMDGTRGWVHQATLTGRRSFVVIGADDRTLRAEGSDAAEAVAVLKPGVIGRLKSCDAAASWCQVQVGDYRGWLKRGDFWGVDPNEVVVP
jgi:SH3-like domain-containing protein